MALDCYNCSNKHPEEVVLADKEDREVDRKLIKKAREDLTAFCSEKCRDEYNNDEPDPEIKKKTNFDHMSGAEITKYVQARAKSLIEAKRANKKALEEELEREWQEKQKAKKNNSDEKKIKTEADITIKFKDKDTFDRAVKVMTEEDEEEKQEVIAEAQSLF